MEKNGLKISSLQMGNRRGMIIIIVGVAVGILLLISGTFVPERKESQMEEDSFYAPISYTESLEKRIEELCTSIAGITDATVLLTLENGKETVYAGNTTSQNSDTTNGQTFDYIIMNRNGGEEPVLITEIYPTIRGVAVVCTNGEEAAVQITITKLLAASLGISTNRIQVAGS